MKLFWQIIVWGALAGLTIGSSALFKANADPIDHYTLTAENAVCTTLDSYPSLTGVAGVLQGIKEDSGFTITQSAQVLVQAVTYRCPQYLPLLQEFADTAPKAVSAV